MNEEGPVRDDVLEAKRLIMNLCSFMRKEGYPEDEIAKICE